MKVKKLVKHALKHPGQFTPAELAYFKMWLMLRKEAKKAKKAQKLKKQQKGLQQS